MFAEEPSQLAVGAWKTAAKLDDPATRPGVLRGKYGQADQDEQDTLKQGEKQPDNSEHNEPPSSEFQKDALHPRHSTRMTQRRLSTPKKFTLR